jgi:hypothetical protein
VSEVVPEPPREIPEELVAAFADAAQAEGEDWSTFSPELRQVIHDGILRGFHAVLEFVGYAPEGELYRCRDVAELNGNLSSGEADR